MLTFEEMDLLFVLGFYFIVFLILLGIVEKVYRYKEKRRRINAKKRFLKQESYNYRK